MENVGKMMSEGEWNNNFSHEMYSSSSSPDEEANFMAQLLGTSLPSDQCWSLQESAKMDETSIYSSSSDEFCHLYQGSTNGFNNGSLDHCFPPYSLGLHHQVLEAQDANSLDHCYGFLSINQVSSFDGSMESNEINPDDNHHQVMNIYGTNLHLGTLHDDMMMINVNNDDQTHSSLDEKVSSPSSHVAKKRPRAPMANVEKDERSLRRKKKQKAASLPSHGHEEEEEEEDDDDDDDNKISNIPLKRQNSTISCWSADEDDSIVPSRSSSSKRGGAIPNKNGKTRASRGSATDPQSLYARKRRERINERLKILQNLVPNGTKVDISTMLEEAVQYVKFLQVQIKLLSSNDLWMYAPIAYNGMDIGLDLKIATANKS